MCLKNYGIVSKQLNISKYLTLGEPHDSNFLNTKRSHLILRSSKWGMIWYRNLTIICFLAVVGRCLLLSPGRRVLNTSTTNSGINSPPTYFISHYVVECRMFNVCAKILTGGQLI